jgi:SPP1 gp7 family putative phage head morphogenesis protein
MKGRIICKEGGEKASPHPVPDAMFSIVKMTTYPPGEEFKTGPGWEKPYTHLDELPASVRRLPERLQRLWMAVFNATWENNQGMPKEQREQLAFQAAWGVVNREMGKDVTNCRAWLGGIRGGTIEIALKRKPTDGEMQGSVGQLVTNRLVEVALRSALTGQEPKTIAAILSMWRALKRSVPEDELARAIASGDLPPLMMEKFNRVLDDIAARVKTGQEVVGKAGQKITADGVANVTAGGGGAGLGGGAGSGSGTIISYEQTARRLSRWISARNEALRGMLGNVNSEALGQMLYHFTVENPVNPLASARYIRHAIGLTDREALAVVRLQEGLASSGTAQAVIDRKAGSYSNYLLRRRAERIARTEYTAAFNQAGLETVRTAVDLGILPPEQGTARKTWLTSEDELVCPYCGGMDGQTVGVDEEFTDDLGGSGVDCPPLHPNCRCTTLFHVSKDGT